MGKAMPPGPKEWEPAHHWHQGQKTMTWKPFSEAASLKNPEIMPFATSFSQRLAELPSNAKIDMLEVTDMENVAHFGNDECSVTCWDTYVTGSRFLPSKDW